MDPDRTSSFADRDEPSDPATMLAMLRTQESRTRAATSVDGARLYLAWGLALTFGYLALYVTWPDHAWAVAPYWVGGIILAILLSAAGVVSYLHIRQRSAGLSGPANRQATLWGVSWLVGFVGMELIGMGLIRHGLPEDVMTAYFSGMPLLVSGMMYLSGGALWSELSMYWLGAWMVLIAGVSVIIGLPAGLLLVGLLAGGAMIGTAAALRRAAHSRSGFR